MHHKKGCFRQQELFFFQDIFINGLYPNYIPEHPQLRLSCYNVLTVIFTNILKRSVFKSLLFSKKLIYRK